MLLAGLGGSHAGADPHTAKLEEALISFSVALSLDPSDQGAVAARAADARCSKAMSRRAKLVLPG